MDDKPKRLIQSFIHPTSIYRGVCYVSDTVLRSGITEMKAIRGSLAYSMGGNIGEIQTGIKCDKGAVLLGHRRKDPDPGQVVPEEVSLERSLSEQMGKDLAH